MKMAELKAKCKELGLPVTGEATREMIWAPQARLRAF